MQTTAQPEARVCAAGEDSRGLEEGPCERMPRDWARAQYILGAALTRLGQRIPNKGNFREAFFVVDNVLVVYRMVAAKASYYASGAIARENPHGLVAMIRRGDRCC